MSTTMMRHDVDINPQAMKNFIERRVSPISESMGLKRTHGQFLMVIYENEGTSLKELSEEMFVDKALTTRVVRSLITNGFIVDMNEGSREYSLYLTEKGKDAVESIGGAIDGAWEELLKDLTEEERETLARIHSKIIQRLKDDVEVRR